jgi:hypothetical protein
LYATLIHLYKKGRIHTERKKYFFSDHAYPENVFTFRTFHNALQEALKKGCVPDTIGIAGAEGAPAEKRSSCNKKKPVSRKTPARAFM